MWVRPGIEDCTTDNKSGLSTFPVDKPLLVLFLSTSLCLDSLKSTDVLFPTGDNLSRV